MNSADKFSFVEAQARFAKISEDIVLLHLRVPENQEADTLDDFLNNTPSVRVVVTSSGPKSSAQNDAKRAPAYEFMPKAIGPNTGRDAGQDTPNSAPEIANQNELIGKPLKDIERIVIEQTISGNSGSIPRAARVLGVSPSTIYRKMESWRTAG
ncbi:MAG: helix-turn-helix domain-containing protein [Marinosulfonomonas sp.]